MLWVPSAKKNAAEYLRDVRKQAREKTLAWPSDVEETVTLACLVASQRMKRLYLHEDAGSQKWFHILGHYRNFKAFLKKQVGVF